MDVSPKQVVSVATALIPFLEHDDANRALMGSNMQRQAVPAPGARGADRGHRHGASRGPGLGPGRCIAREDGVVTSVTAERVLVEEDAGELRTYPLQKFVRSNQGTCINQRPIVEVGQRVAREIPIADSSSTDGGELALGRNILVAFMSWEGGNYEDAIVISDRLVREDLFTSIHIEKHEIESRDTKLGRRRSPGTSRTSARSPSRTSTRTASSTSAPRSSPATSWWARSRPRARRS